jgi:hypothetical protein
VYNILLHAKQNIISFYYIATSLNSAMTISNQTYNVARGLVRAKSTAGGAHRLFFINTANDSTINRFIPGSGVGGLNRSVRRYQYRQATSCQTASGTQRTGQCVAY